MTSPAPRLGPTSFGTPIRTAHGKRRVMALRRYRDQRAQPRCSCFNHPPIHRAPWPPTVQLPTAWSARRWPMALAASCQACLLSACRNGAAWVWQGQRWPQWRCSWAERPLIDLLAHLGDALRSQDQSSITRLPASAILTRPPTDRTSALTVSRCAVASPALTRPAGVRRVKPWLNMITSAAPNGLEASNWSARRCSGFTRRFREGTPASMAIFIRVLEMPRRFGRGKSGWYFREPGVSQLGHYSISEFSVSDCRAPDAGRQYPPKLCGSDVCYFRLETVEKPTDNKASRRFATRTDASFRL